MKDGGPAFPQGEAYQVTDLAGNTTTNRRAALHGGMSLRDFFAAKAMQGLIGVIPNSSNDVIAQQAYELADAMLAEREKGG